MTVFKGVDVLRKAEYREGVEKCVLRECVSIALGKRHTFPLSGNANTDHVTRPKSVSKNIEEANEKAKRESEVRKVKGSALVIPQKARAWSFQGSCSRIP